MELNLADENNLGEGVIRKHQALIAATRVEEAQLESQIYHCPEEHPLCEENGLSLLPPLPPKESQKLAFRLLTSFQNENKTAFYLPHTLSGSSPLNAANSKTMICKLFNPRDALHDLPILYEQCERHSSPSTTAFV